MKNKFTFLKEIKQMRKISPFLLVSLVVIFLLITGCVDLNETRVTNTETPILTFTITPRPTITVWRPKTKVPTPTKMDPTATPLLPPLSEMTIKETQMPVQISMVKPVDGQYLYQKANVRLILNSLNGVVFLNLDDFSDNSQQNSDFLIYVDTGSGGTTFEMFPTNFARYYYSDNATMDYTSCMESMPKTSAEWVAQFDDYPILDRMIETGNAYCILTNEGRMAVVNMVIPYNYNYIDDQGNFSLPLVVTVYSRIVTELFVPAPTQTTGPSPTATNRYSERNISDPDQIKMLNESIQAFIDAIKIGNKTAIVNMVDYPIYIRLLDTGEVIQLNDQTDFLLNYDNIFSIEIETELAKATIEDNVRSYPGAIELKLKNGAIIFTDEGKIDDIY